MLRPEDAPTLPELTEWIVRRWRLDGMRRPSTLWILSILPIGAEKIRKYLLQHDGNP